MAVIIERMAQARGTAAQWAASNPVLLAGELGYETDTFVIKFGDGVTPWNSLPPPALAARNSPTFTGDPKAPTPAPGDNDTSIATTAFVQAAITAAILAMHPIGSLEFNVTGTNPGTYLGGTWIAWGTGRVPVGVDTGQTEFNTVEKTGGFKTHTLVTAEMPAHFHGGATGNVSNDHTHTIPGKSSDTTTAGGSSIRVTDVGGLGGGLGTTGSGTTGGSSANHNHAISSEGGGGAHNNLQPYITCYVWKRTA